jgi:dienelactone hydrolase
MYKRLPIVVLLLFFLASTSTAADIEGSWAGTLDAPGVLAAMRLNITSEKGFASSTLIFNLAGSESASPIQNFTLNGDVVSFTGEFFKQEVRFVGKFRLDNLSGSFEIFRNGAKTTSGEWNLRRFNDSVLSKAANVVPATPNGKVELPKPTGSFPIGRRAFYWTDESRPETITDDPNDKRKLFVQLWYPAKKSDKNSAAAYFPNLEELQTKNPNLAVLRTVQTHAKADVPIGESKASFPVVVFSPGQGVSSFEYTAIIESLASHGFVVAAINHAYDAGNFKFSDGQTIRYATDVWDKPLSASWTQEMRKKFFDERRKGWAEDISFVVNQLISLNGEGLFKRRLDTENIGVLGHSFGGQAATIACAEDKRLKACANLDGLAQGMPFLPNSKGENLKQPFLFFTKDSVATDYELKIMGLTRSQYDARERKRMLERWRPSLKTRLESLEAGAYLAVFRGAIHQSFSDIPLLEANPKDETLVDRQLRAKIINEYILAFFDRFLRKGNSPLLDSQNQSHPQVVLEYLRKDEPRVTQ